MALRPTPVILTDADGAPAGGIGGGGGGPATIADGADVAQGFRADAAYAAAGSGTVIALLKGIWNRLVPAGAAASAASQPVTIATDDAAIGAPAAAAYAGGATGTLISILKGIYAACIASTPAGTNNIGIVAPQDGFMPGGTAGYTANSAATLFTQDMTGYPVISVQLLGTWAGTVIFEVSNDGATWHSKSGSVSTATGSVQGDQISTTLSGQTLEFAVSEKQFRARVSAYTSGTVQVVPTLRTGAVSPRSVYVGGNVGVSTGTNSFGSLGATASVSGISLTSRLLSSAATTNANSVKASAGRAYKVYGYNASASIRYLKLYNKATAPTVGTDTPVITRAIPPGSFSIDWADVGYSFSAGISYALTGAVADADTTAIAAGDIVAFGVEYA